MQRHPWLAFARVFLLAVVLVASSLGCASRARADETADIAAFARLYGAVRYYYPGDVLRSIDWNRFAVYGVAQLRTQHDLGKTLRELFAPVAAGVQVVPENQPFAPFDAGGQPQVAVVHLGFDAQPRMPYSVYANIRFNRPAPPSASDEAAKYAESLKKFSGTQTAPGRAAEFSLGQGLKARVPLSLPDAYARSGEDANATAQLRAALEAMHPDASDVRVADVVVAWNALRHFYPYWKEAQVDWDSRLPSLVGASLASNDAASHDVVLRKLVEAIRDGHGRVGAGRAMTNAARLQVAVGAVGGDWVVTGSAIPGQVAVGDVVRSIDGTDAATYFADQMRLVSGSPQWKAHRAVENFNNGPDGTKRSVRFAGPKGEYGLRLQYAFIDPATVDTEARRPTPVGELEPGIWYIDVTRTSMEQVTPKLDEIAKGKALIVDVRGYPGNAGMQLLPHLIDAPEHDRWMHLPVWTAPFAEPAAYEDVGWDVSPRPPHIGGARYVLMDGSAISYAESVLGYYVDLKLATTIGSASAGANGNIQTFGLPSGTLITFTGMKVTRHDGVGQIHLVGVVPEVKVQPTAQSLREGRDVVLERALELARAATAKQAAP